MSRFLLFFLLFPLIVNAQLAVPDQGGLWVHDEANVLSASGKAEIEAMIRAERDSTSNQIGVLIIPELGDEVPEEYSLRVAEQWKIGQKGKDNGVLLLIAIKERKIRIETGYGMEGTLTDALSSRINRNEIAPHFQTGDYDGGVKAGVIAITQAVKGEYKNDDPAPKRRSSRRSPFLTIIVIIIIIIIASRRNRRGGGGYWSSGGGFMGPMGGFGGGSSGSDSGFSGGDFGGGGGFGGGGSSDSW